MSVVPLVELASVSLRFGATHALRGVSFDVRRGEVHVLAGANGAGKSTLIGILAGAHTVFEGELRIDGVARRFAGPADARRAKIATIHQELSLVGSMSVADNLFLGRPRMGRFGGVDERRQRREAAAILKELALDIDPDARVEDLPLFSQQLVEIGKALAGEVAVLIMDEPTSALDDTETAMIFTAVRRLRAQGRGVVFISHKIDEMYALADRITVLRDGAVAGTARAADLPPAELVRWMVGRSIETPKAAPHGAFGDMVLDVHGLHVPRSSGSDAEIESASLSLRRGEIVGLSGLRGAGMTELLHGLFGSRPGSVATRITLDGRPFALEGPARSIEQGMVLLTSDRKRSGIVPDLGVVENATLASLRRFSPLGWLRPREEREAVRHLAARVRLGDVRLDAALRTLSGGGQQKVCLARCLLARGKILLLDEPTRGVDVAAKADIYALIREATAEGAAVLLTTSDLDELVALSDRILVMHRGRIGASIDRANASAEAVMHATMAAGVSP